MSGHHGKKLDILGKKKIIILLLLKLTSWPGPSFLFLVVLRHWVAALIWSATWLCIIMMILILGFRCIIFTPVISVSTLLIQFWHKEPSSKCFPTVSFSVRLKLCQPIKAAALWCSTHKQRHLLPSALFSAQAKEFCPVIGWSYPLEKWSCVWKQTAV